MGDQSIVDIANLEHDLSKKSKRISIESPLTAFSELSVAEPTPIVQTQFPYNINADIWEIRDNKGS